MLHGKKSAIYKSKSGSNGILFQKLFWPTVKKNCSSDWDFFGYHKNNFWNRVLYWLVTGGFCRSLFIRTIKMQVGTNKWDVKTCRKKSKKVVWFAKRGAKKSTKFHIVKFAGVCRLLSTQQGCRNVKNHGGGGHNLPPPDWNRVNVSAKNCWGPVSPPRSYTFRYPYSEEGLENCSLINCLVSVLLMSVPLWPDYVKYRLKIVYFLNFSVFSKI